MTGHDIQHTNPNVWPPAVPLPDPVPQYRSTAKATRAGKASVWAAEIGIFFWVCLSTGLLKSLVYHDIWFGGGLENHLMNAEYLMGGVCELAAIGLGLLSNRTKPGTIGLIVSIAVLCSMIMVTLAGHHLSGHWIWNATRGFDNGRLRLRGFKLK